MLKSKKNRGRKRESLKKTILRRNQSVIIMDTVELLKFVSIVMVGITTEDLLLVDIVELIEALERHASKQKMINIHVEQ